MPQTDSLRRLGGGRWETRDGRFAIEPQSGTWVVVDNERTDELGLPLVRGPFGSLTAAREAIDTARGEGPAASPLAERIERARQAGGGSLPAAKPAKAGSPATSPSDARPAAARRTPAPEPPAEPAPPPEPAWLRDLEPVAQRRARDLIARLERMRIADPERIARAEIADGQPALARLALERAIGAALASSGDAPAARAPGAVRATVRAAVRAILRGSDLELGTGWRLVDDQGRRIEKLEIPDE